MKRILSGNQAVAFGALSAGVKAVTGYPGTPSTGCIEHLLTMDLPDRHVEWSTNEKVAFEIAAGAAWAGHRAMCTMKMSGVNVAYDALISIAHSGTNGGLLIYVADDPGRADRVRAVRGSRQSRLPAAHDNRCARAHRRRRRRPNPAAGDRTDPGEGHRPLHQGRRGDLPATAPRPDRAARTGRRVGSRQEAQQARTRRRAGRIGHRRRGRGERLPQ